jgi:hypothetical protein
MQVKLRGALVAALVAFVSTGAALAAAKMTNVLPTPVSGGRTDVPETIKAKSNMLSEAERQGIEKTVRFQLMAILSRDARRAFATLAPSTQHYFARPDAYLETVVTELSPILAARQFSFLVAGRDEMGANQLVLITDADGRDWLATFQVERQPAGDWRVRDLSVEAAGGELT